MCLSLFHMRSPGGVTKCSHQDCGPCYIHLSIFSYTYTLLFCSKKKSFCDGCFSQQGRPQTTVQLNILCRGFSWGRRLVILADHWTTNDLKVAWHKSITIIYFFLSEIIFCEKMVSLSNNDRFDNDKIFLRKIWHFSVKTRINYVSIFFVYILKIHGRTSL